MRMKDVLSGKGGRVISVWSSRMLRDVVALLDGERIASVIVTTPDGQPIGIVTDRDVIHALAFRGSVALDEPVSAAMQKPAPVCDYEDAVSSVLRIMTDRRIRHLLVLKDGAIAGLVSIGDLVKVRLDDAEVEGRVLRERALGQMAFER